MSTNSARTLLARTVVRSAPVRAFPRSARQLSVLSTASSPLASRIATRTSFIKPTTVASIRFKSTDKAWGPPLVSYEELKPLTQQPSDDVLIVDVREPDEVALGAIPSSVSLPLSVLPKHLSSTYDTGSFVKEHMFHKPLPAQKMIFYCRSGKRSAQACQLAQEAGYKNVRNYVGSWLDWRKNEEAGQMAGRGEDDD